MSLTSNRAFLGAALVSILAGTTLGQNDNPRRTTRQPVTDAERERIRDDNSGQTVVERWVDDYFGSSDTARADLAKLDRLAGAWDMKITMFDTSSASDKIARTSMGYAERRWTLDGTLLVERYTFAGDPGSMPLQPREMYGSPRDSDRMDDRNNMNDREGMKDSQNRDRTDRTGDTRNNPNRPSGEDEPGSQRVTTQPMNPDRTDAARPAGARAAERGNAGDQGIVLWGYDAAADEFNVAWTDNSTSAIRFDKGELDESGTLTLNGSYVDPTDNETYQTRTVIRMVSPDQQRLTMYKDGGVFAAEQKVLEIVYSRADMNTWDKGQDQDRSNNRNRNDGMSPQREGGNNADRDDDRDDGMDNNP